MIKVTLDAKFVGGEPEAWINPRNISTIRNTGDGSCVVRMVDGESYRVQGPGQDLVEAIRAQKG